MSAPALLDLLGGSVQESLDLEQAPRVGRSLAREYTAPVDERPCPVCNGPVPWEYNQRAVIILEGELRWACQLCAVKALGHRTETMGWHSQREHPYCARCAKPWDDHFRDCPRRYCDDGEEYEWTPGIPGVEPVEWLGLGRGVEWYAVYLSRLHAWGVRGDSIAQAA